MHRSLHLQDYVLIGFVLTAVLVGLIAVIAMFLSDRREQRQLNSVRYTPANR